MRAARVLIMGLAALAISLGTTRAFAQDKPSGDGSAIWPDGKSWRIHGVGAASFGTCTRFDPDVGASGVCGEAIVGLDIPFQIRRARFRFDPELGFGWSASATTTDSALGVSIASGGASLSTRPLFTWDVTRLFFLRAGPELRATYLLDTFATSVRGVLDLGTRFGDILELGLRGYAGVDGIEKAQDGKNSEWSAAFAWGTMFLARVYTR